MYDPFIRLFVSCYPSINKWVMPGLRKFDLFIKRVPVKHNFRIHVFLLGQGFLGRYYWFDEITHFYIYSNYLSIRFYRSNQVSKKMLMNETVDK